MFTVECNKTAVKSFVSDVLYQESIKKSSSLSNSLNIVSKLSHAVRIDDNTFEILTILKTGMTSIPDDDIFALENYAFVWNLKGSDWNKPFTSRGGVNRYSVPLMT